MAWAGKPSLVFRQEAFPMRSDELYDGVTRRSVLKTGAATAGAVTIGAAGAAAHHDDDHDEGGNGDNEDGNGDDNGGNGGKQGGRAQVDDEDDVRQNEPFTIQPNGGDMRNASCMSEESEMQAYLQYDIQYCEGDDDDATLYVIPDEAPLVQDQVYEFRAVQECKATDNQMVAFGPSNQEC